MYAYFIALIASLIAYPAIAHDAVALLKDANQKTLGLVEFEEGKNGVLATIEIQNISPGWHAIHVHETNDCGGEGFKTAGGHANAHHHSHGLMGGKGLHAGDMPNIWVHRDGTARAQAFMHHVSLHDLIDADGAAVIVHAGQDDYSSQPSGNAGPRIACGGLTR